jgi:hypothetical protein
MSLIPVFNKNLPRTHTELEFDVLGVHGKLVKIVVHLSKNKIEKNHFSSHKLPKQQSTSFWSQGILGVKGLGLLPPSSLFPHSKAELYFVGDNPTSKGMDPSTSRVGIWQCQIYHQAYSHPWCLWSISTSSRIGKMLFRSCMHGNEAQIEVF